VEECHQQGKGQAGLDQHQVRLWPSFHRHTVLSMCALALLAVAAARPLPPAPLQQGTEGSPASAGAQPADWADTGALPSSAGQKPPAEIGMVKISVPEARRLLHLATAPMTATARASGHAWSRWRREHQARARWHHYQARLPPAPA
jgi:hypothetical protein